MDSFSGFDAKSFSRAAGISLFSGIAAAAFAVREGMNAAADDAATADALASWQELVAHLETEIATLQHANACLAGEVAQLNHQLLIADAERATSRQRLAQRQGAGPSV